MGQIFDWIYGKLAGFFSEFFEMMNMMGAELFDLPWTQAVVLFFSRFAWVLYAVGLVVAGFEYAIQSQSGRGDLHGLALNGIKGFMAVSLFTTVPVELYRLCVTLQGTFASGLAQLMGGEDGSIGSLTRAAMGALNGYGAFVGLFLLILLGYAVFKVFFANLRRGGILLIQIAVGSLYFFSVPRGYLDGFWNWGKQVAGLCLTAFLQTTMLVAGLMVWNTNMLGSVQLQTATAREFVLAVRLEDVREKEKYRIHPGVHEAGEEERVLPAAGQPECRGFSAAGGGGADKAAVQHPGVPVPVPSGNCGRGKIPGSAAAGRM